MYIRPPTAGALYCSYMYAIYGHMYIQRAKPAFVERAATACKADHPTAECTSGHIIIIILSYRRARLTQRVIITQNVSALPDRTKRRHRRS